MAGSTLEYAPINVEYRSRWKKRVYGVPTFFATESSKYNAGSFLAGAACHGEVSNLDPRRSNRRHHLQKIMHRNISSIMARKKKKIQSNASFQTKPNVKTKTLQQVYNTDQPARCKEILGGLLC